MFSSRGTVRYEERGQGYRDVEKVGKHWSNPSYPQLKYAFLITSFINTEISRCEENCFPSDKLNTVLFSFLFCTTTNKCTIISQINTLVHVSTLLYVCVIICEIIVHLNFMVTPCISNIQHFNYQYRD